MTEPVAALISRIERLEAIADITRLSAEYCRGADRRELDRFLSVWTEDAVWRVRDDLAFVGLAEIQRGIERQWEMTLRAFHWTSNPSISIDEGGASARAVFDVHTEVQLADESWLWLGGSYRDTYTRTDTAWRLSSRTAEIAAKRPV
jgi:hypothetical protein